MRITPEQQHIIVDAVHQFFGRQGKVLLFGSRVDDQGKGGDLDLLVELPHLPDDSSWQAARLEARLQQLLGEQKIDVILAGPENANWAIVQEASQTGVLL